MQRGGGGDGSRRETRATKADVAQAEDFLFHLHRGSDMLLKNRVLEAKEELERALHYQPQDAKSQDLLAGVYFRLGLYPRAIEIWSSLVSAYSTDATLRVNLALAYVKTGQTDEALDHVMGALRIQPDHERAWGYLGLVHWRRGNINEARDAFLRAGQASMARRMEELLDEGSSDADADRHRVAADAALRQISDPPPPQDLSAVVASVAAPLEIDRANIGASVVELVSDAASKLRTEEGCSLDSPSRLSIRGVQGYVMRVDLAHAVASAGPGLGVHRRSNGIDLVAMLGGERAFHRFSGSVEALLEAEGGRRFQVLHVEEDGLVVAESRLVAFSSGLEFDCDSIALIESDLVVVRFSGRGEVVVDVSAPIRTLRVVRGRDARIRPDALVAFNGDLAATAATGVTPLALVLRGEGTALLA